MEDELRQDGTPGTERSRRRSGVPGVAAGGAPDEPLDDVREHSVEEPIEDLSESSSSKTGSEAGSVAPRPSKSINFGARLVKPEDARQIRLSPVQRLLLLDTWERSGLPAGDFATLVGVSRDTLWKWKRRFEREGPAGLEDQPKRRTSHSLLPEVTKRAILMLKQANPDFGCQRISDLLVRGPALPASSSAVAKVLHEAGYELEESPTRPHGETMKRFERARPNQLWQTDLFTFILKRQNRRVHLFAFMDDHSRFVVGYGLYASASTALVLEVLRAAISSYGVPQELLTDNGPQYVTWRGKSAFSRELEKRGIRHLVATPKHPQTLGKVERFWGTLWRECVQTSIFLDLEDARKRVGLFIDHYNFHRPHQGLEGLVPADRFFHAAPEVLKTLRARVAANALELARNGVPKKPFYLTGQVGGKTFSVHAEGERVFLTNAPEGREEIDLVAPQPVVQAREESAPPALPEVVTPGSALEGTLEVADEELPPGASVLDEGTLRAASEAEEAEPLDETESEYLAEGGDA